MYNAAVAQWSTQRSKKPSLIGCGFESHQPHIFCCSKCQYASLAEWYTQQAQTLSLIGSQFDSEERYKEAI